MTKVGKKGRKSVEFDWVNCGACGRWEVFENCKRELGLEEFDAKEVKEIVFTCRMCVQDTRLEKLEARVDVLTGKFEELVGCKLQEMMDEEGQKVAAIGCLVEKLETEIGEVASKVAVDEMWVEERLSKVESLAGDSLSKVAVMESQMAKLVQEWPTPAESKAMRVRQESTSPKVSFQDRVKNMPSESVLVVGDSMARGLGKCLENDGGGMVKSIAYGGAKIEDLETRVWRLGDKPESHLVLVVGTNNLCKEGSEVIRKRFQSLMGELRKHRFRKVSFVGILRRKVNSYLDSRRMGINLMLRRMCEENGMGFVDEDVDLGHLARDGLHLNAEGADYMARAVFSHYRQYLN
jgi:hypothetical protein